MKRAPSDADVVGGRFSDEYPVVLLGWARDDLFSGPSQRYEHTESVVLGLEFDGMVLGKIVAQQDGG